MPSKEERDNGKQFRKQILDLVTQGFHTTNEIATMMNMSVQNVGYYLKKLKADGLLVNPSIGKWELPFKANGNQAAQTTPTTVQKVAATVRGLAESASRKIQLPEFMRGRKPITLFVEYSPQELEDVLRLELQIGGILIPVQGRGDLRVCLGDDIPRYSATQETYNGVTMYRVTFSNGEQKDFGHNPQIPLTIDAK